MPNLPDATSPVPETRRGAWWYGRTQEPPMSPIRRPLLALPSAVACTAMTLILINLLVAG